MFWQGRFCQEMEEHSYPNWRLRNVALVVKFCCGTVCSWKAMKGRSDVPIHTSSNVMHVISPRSTALVKAVPSLQSFNGQGDLSVSEKWGDSGVYTAMLDARNV